MDRVQNSIARLNIAGIVGFKKRIKPNCWSGLETINAIKDGCGISWLIGQRMHNGGSKLFVGGAEFDAVQVRHGELKRSLFVAVSGSAAELIPCPNVV